MCIDVIFSYSTKQNIETHKGVLREVIFIFRYNVIVGSGLTLQLMNHSTIRHIGDLNRQNETRSEFMTVQG